MPKLFECPYCGKANPSENGTGSDVACCGEVGHAKEVLVQRSWEGYLHDPDAGTPGARCMRDEDCRTPQDCEATGLCLRIDPDPRKANSYSYRTNDD